MSGRLVVITGMPGTGVELSIRKFIEWRVATGQAREDSKPVVIKLEDHFRRVATDDVRRCLQIDTPRGESARLYDVLRLPKPVLMPRWRDAFDACLEDAKKHRKADRDIFLTFHACWYHLGNKEYVSGIDFARLLEDDADAEMVITFIDDAYDIRSRLSVEGGVLQPPLSQYSDSADVLLKLLLILDWRAFEIGLSEKVANAIAGGRHFLFAVKHPLRTLNALLYGDAKSLYISHHISELRRMRYRSDDDRRTAEEMMQTIQALARELRPVTVLFEPTTIDEARFDYKRESPDGDPLIVPKLGPRWPMASERIEDLAWVPPQHPLPELGEEWAGKADRFAGSSELTREDFAELGTASALLQPLMDKIISQINSRDHFLVEHAEAIAVYRPYLFGHPAGGVKEELQHHQRLLRAGITRARAVILHPPADDAMRKRRAVGSCFRQWYQTGDLVGTEADFNRMQNEIIRSEEVSRDLLTADLRTVGRAIRQIPGRFGLRFRPAPSAGALGPAQAINEQEADEARARTVAVRLQENYLREFEGAQQTTILHESLGIEAFARRIATELQ